MSSRSYVRAGGVVAAVGLVVLVLLWIRRGDDRMHDHVPTDVVTGESSGSGDTASSGSDSYGQFSSRNPAGNAADPSTALPKPVSYEQFLQEYWGADWPEMRKKLEEWCFVSGQTDCLARMIESPPLPWEDVASLIQAEVLDNAAHSAPARSNLIDWPDQPVTEQDIRGRFKVPNGVELDPAQLAVIEGIGAKYNSEIHFRSGAWQAALQEAVSGIWAAGKYSRGPLILPGYQGSDALHTITLTRDGWCVNVVVKRDEYPWLADAISEMNAVKKARNDEIQAYLAALR